MWLEGAGPGEQGQVHMVFCIFWKHRFTLSSGCFVLFHHVSGFLALTLHCQMANEIVMVEPRSTQAGICEWTSLSRRVASEILRHQIRVSRQIDTPRRHVCGPTSGGSRAGRQRGSKRISCFHFRGAQAQPLRSSGTGVLR